MGQKKRFALTVGINVGLFVIFIMALPYVGALILKKPTIEDNIYSTPFVGGGDDIEPLFEEENPMVYVQIPHFIKETETKIVKAYLEEVIPSVGLMQHHTYRTLKYSASLNSPAFDISPNKSDIAKSGEGYVEWEWLITPKKTGYHKIKVEFDKPVISTRSIEKIKVNNNKKESISALTISESSIISSVVVLTSLGLTATQNAILKSIGAVIAFIGTLVGYPFWKRFVKEGRIKETNGYVFRDDFSKFLGWVNVPPGGVQVDSSKSYTGSASLKKYGANDPSGGYKKINKIKRGFVFSGWVYRPIESDGGPADRLSVEDKQGNGYGFAVRHEDESILLVIEKRIDGAFDNNLNSREIKSPFKSLKDKWYSFDFQITNDSKIILNIDCDNKRIGHIKVEDTEFKRFHRIAVRGGHPYYVDDLKIRFT